LAHVIRIDGATPSNISPTSDWGRDEFTILSWIYGPISVVLLGIIMRPGSTTRMIWDAIENLLCDNKSTAPSSSRWTFHNTPQGDLSISHYCTKLKSLTDSLADIGQPVSDENLVLTLLRGLNDTYTHLHLFLPF
jgi:hypothetical protein